MANCDRSGEGLMYYNVTLQILSCACVSHRLEENHEEDYSLPVAYQDQPSFETSLFSKIQNFFEKATDIETVTNIERPAHGKDQLGESCHVLRNYTYIINHGYFSNSTIIYVLSTAILIFLSIWITWYRLCKIHRRKSAKALEKVNTEQMKERKIPIENVPSNTLPVLDTDILPEQLPLSDTFSRKEKKGSIIKLFYQSYVNGRSEEPLNTAEFLNGTIDKLYQKLDKMLISNTTSPGSSVVTAVNATPRLSRRSIHGRRRMGSSPSLQLYDNGTESLPSASTPNITGSLDWKTFKQYCEKMIWKQPSNQKLNDANYDHNVQQLLRYFQRVCPISQDVWSSATMITNYAMLLIETELCKLVTSKGYRCVDLVPSGSGMQGNKVGKANQFDVLMVLQPPVLPCGIICLEERGRIPPGHVLVNARTDTASSLMKQGLICKMDFSDSETPYYLSANEFYYAAEEMIDTCLQTLYTKIRLQMDRLPFKMSKSNTSSLSITLDTKNIVGLGLSDIRISMYPVMFLPTDGWFQNVPVYANPVVPDDQNDFGTSLRKSLIPTETLWTLNFSAVYTAFMDSINIKMKHAGVRSCHSILLMLLKSLFTGCNKNNLLDRGELQTRHITHVISFLLLESSPQQWTFDHLADRFSDTVHFLQDAFSNERLPNFFLNNPNLTKKVPFVASNSLFQSSRQHNILSDVPNKTKCLEYIEKCLRESGLIGCVKDGYSSDMWEYEFFVY